MAARDAVIVAALTAVAVLAAGCSGDAPTRDEQGSLEAPSVQGLVAEGAHVFSTACASCHGAGGEGLEGRAPSLRRSAWLLGSPSTVIRIVLDGVRSEEAERSGAYVLPMAAWRVLPDRDLAAVLTYARRSWGHHAAAVAPEDVASVRAATAGRSRPWSRDELRELREGPGHAQAVR